MDTPAPTSMRPAPSVTAARTLPAAILVGITAALAWRETGSIAAHHWLPYAVLAALTLAVVFLAGGARRPHPLALAGVAALLLLAGFAALSLTWSPLPSLARDEALLTAFYAVALAIPVFTLRSTDDRLAALGALVAGITAIALGTGAVLWLHDDPAGLYDEGRLYFPISYANAQAALFLLGFWPAVGLAARRWSALPVRALGVGAGGALLAGWLMTQSKGAGVGLVASAIVFFAICPARLRVLVPTLIAAAAAAAGAAPLTAPFRADDAGLAASINRAGLVLLLVFAGGTLAGLAYALADRRLALGERGHRVGARAALALLVAIVVGSTAAYLVSVDRPVGYLGDKWESFKEHPEAETGGTHFSTLGSNRYDFWSVALGEFREHPLAGIGSRGFGAVYLQEGNGRETPARAHSLVFEILMENGVVGFVLLFAAFASPLYLAARYSRRLPAAAAFAGVTSAFAHAAVDWTWTFPAVGVPLFLLLGIGASPDDRGPLLPRVRRASGAAALALALLVFGPPWLSARLTERSYAQDDPSRDLRWARRLDPISLSPLYAEAQRALNPADAVRPLELAAAKEPRSVSPQYALGVAYFNAGRREDAVRALQRANDLAPGEPLVVTLLVQLGAAPTNEDS